MKKKIVYIHQYFKTPSEPGGTRSYWFSLGLIRQGYHVVMLTSRSNQTRYVCRETIDGIDVIYIKNRYRNNFGIFRRLISFCDFMLVSTFIAIREKNISLVFATSTPLTVGFTALVLKFVRKLNYVFEVRDLWPEVPIQMGAINNNLIKKIAFKFERIIYKNACHIIALSPGMETGIISQIIPKLKITVIPNMAKIDKFFQRPVSKEVMQKYGLSTNDFYVIHFGAMGIANGLEYILDAAKILNSDNPIIKFLFAGEGGQETKLRRICTETNLKNVLFLGKFNMKELSELVNIAHCSITTFAAIEILGTNSPNKLFDSLSAGKPVIVNSAGWTKELVEKNKCGAYVDPKKPQELANLLIDWEKNREFVNQMGENSRKLAEEKFDKSILVPMFIDIMERFS